MLLKCGWLMYEPHCFCYCCVLFDFQTELLPGGEKYIYICSINSSFHWVLCCNQKCLPQEKLFWANGQCTLLKYLLVMDHTPQEAATHSESDTAKPALGALVEPLRFMSLCRQKRHISVHIKQDKRPLCHSPNHKNKKVYFFHSLL